MSEPENFLSRWSRMKREADAAPEPDKQAPSGVPETPPAADAAEPAFDLSKLPSLDQIAGDTDMSMFMKPGVPAALRHAALRRAWTSDPAIRDFRGLQETDWDFNAPDDVPGFGTFKSEDEIKALAQRLFGPAPEEDHAVPQSPPQDSAVTDAVAAPADTDRTVDKDHDLSGVGHPPDDATAAQHEDDVAVHRITARRHGGALPQ